MRTNLDPRAPLVLDTRELGRRPGSQRKVTFPAEAPAELGIEILGVPEGSPVQLDLRLEAVMEGVLVTGTATADLEGECARCLEPIEDEVTVEFQELFLYETPPTGDDEDDDVSRTRGRPDRSRTGAAGRGGACTAVPAVVPGRLSGTVRRLRRTPGGRPGPPARRRRSTRGGPPLRTSRHRRQRQRRTESRRPGQYADRAPDSNKENTVAVPKRKMSRSNTRHRRSAVEGRRALTGDVRQPRVRRQAPAAPCVPRVRSVRRPGRPPPGHLTLSSDTA